MCAYRCALRPALRTVSRLALRGCYKIGSSNFEPLARSYRPANRRTFTAGRYPVAGNYSLIHVLLRCVLALWPCARPAGQSGKVRKQCPSFQAVRIGVGAPFRKLRPCSSFRAVRLWAAVRLSFLPAHPHAGFASRSPCILFPCKAADTEFAICRHCILSLRRPHAGFGACAASLPRFLELYSRESKSPRALVQTRRTDRGGFPPH